MSDRYDVIIVGAGPAGIFAALELVKSNGLKVLMLEKGQEYLAALEMEQSVSPRRP
jgi:flavin-dependent dehydrogenase